MSRSTTWLPVIAITVSLLAMYYWTENHRNSINQTELIKYALNDLMNDNKENGVLFLGSSSIRNWKHLKTDIIVRPVIQRGFGFGRLEDINKYLWLTATQHKPKAIILYAGINDLITSPKSTPEKVLLNFRAFSRNILDSLPTSCIFFISMSFSPALKEYWANIRATNKMIKQFSQRNNQIEFIDTQWLFTSKHGATDKKFFSSDCLHLSKIGYQHWGQSIQSHLDQSDCMARKNHYLNH
ncbi:hypothetical protein ACH42_14910 [Endozoicomonas sp. (ex Bugula neritina AB1)]|nr:hypothetical protein ACH42_14910 [Endozoicomonas sp. (ex Bugula neritina AB1)]